MSAEAPSGGTRARNPLASDLSPLSFFLSPSHSLCAAFPHHLTP